MGLSLFHELTSYDYQPTNEFLAKVYTDPTLRELTRRQLAEILREAHSVPFSVPLDKIKTAIGKEFTGDLPIGRTNLFAIIRPYIEVLRSVSEVGLRREFLTEATKCRFRHRDRQRSSGNY